MKNNKGITLVALVVTILVMLVIVGISITGGSDVLQKTKITEYIGFMKLVKARADVFLEDEIFESGEGLSSDSISDSDITGIINNKSYNDSRYIKKIWGGEEIAAQGIDSSILNPGNDDEFGTLGTDDKEEYFVIIFDKNTYETVDIIYSTGCYYNGDKYYTLVEMEELITDN